MVLINSDFVLAKTKKHNNFTVDNISFNPNFVTVREQNEILVSVNVGKNYNGFPYKKLLLQQKKLSNGRIIYKSIAKLRDNGKKGDEIAGDSIYSARVRFYQKITSNIQLRIVAKKKHHRYQRNYRKHKKKLVSDIFTLPVKNACGPTGTILPVNILTIERGNFNSKSIQFEVPDTTTPSREIILHVVNGAQIDSPISNRIRRAIFTLNDTRVLKLRKYTNIYEIPISLNQGINTLKIKHLRGRPGQSMAVDIVACADQLDLEPVTDTLLASSDKVPAIAKITALGMPVESAKVNFMLSDNLALDNQKTAISQQNGIAQTSFVLTDEGSGQLQAIVENARPELLANVPIDSVSKASILLNQAFQSLTLAPDESEKLPFFLFYLSKIDSQQHVVFDYKIQPDNGGLLIFGGKSPANGFLVTEPKSFELEPIITAISSGDYTLTSQATVLESGETTSSTIRIHIVEPGAPETLTLNLPGFTPSGIPPNIPTIVTVRTLIHGTSTPPDSLKLDQVDALGNLIEAEIVELMDNANNGDSLADDQIYTGQIEISKDTSQSLFYRARAEYFDQEIISGATLFSITPFNLKSGDADTSQLIADTSDDHQIYANEIIVKLLPGTSPEKAEEIARSINGEILSIIPEIQSYRIQFDGDGTLQGLEQAISIVSTFSEVINVSKNSEVTIAATPTPCNWNSSSSTECPNDPDYKDADAAASSTPKGQWHLKTIRVKEAWDAARLINTENFAGSSLFPVAVIDRGVNCGHDELVASNCENVDSDTSEHGTNVAGIIAATSNGEGGVGVAWHTKILSFYSANNMHTLDEDILKAVNSDAKILNLSLTTLSGGLKDIVPIVDAACTAAGKGKLIVAAVGQPTISAPESKKIFFPAALNRVNEKTQKAYHSCKNNSKINLPSYILAVGATNNKDKLAVKSIITDDEEDFVTSNKVDWVDLYAPGIYIKAISGVKNSPTTSYATAQVSAAAAMIWPLMTFKTDAKTLHNHLIETAIDIGDIDEHNPKTGDKRLDLFNAIPKKTVTINFVSEDADFRNLFGIYNRETGKAKIIVENVDLNSNPDLKGFMTTLFLNEEGINKLEFFLIPNGASLNNNYLQTIAKKDRDLEIFKDDNGISRIKDVTDVNNEVILIGANAPALFSEDSRNPEGEKMVRNRSGDTRVDFYLEWEDIPLSPIHRDFDDAIFHIKYN